MKRSLVAASLLLALAGCARTSLPVAQVPENLKPATDETLVAAVAAHGVQIYECRARKDQAQAMEWAFVAPEAELLDSRGRVVGKHYAGPSWESTDGSKVAGSVKARADAPSAGTIPWLLLTTKSFGRVAA